MSYNEFRSCDYARKAEANLLDDGRGDTLVAEALGLTLYERQPNAKRISRHI